MVRVIKGVLRQRGFRAGTYRVGYQSCGADSDDEGACERNARSYAAAKDVLGVIGPFYSSCAAVQIPILSRRAAGPLAMVSPTNTDPGLTLKTRYSDHDPGALYADGVRNYVRVVAPDSALGAVAATLAKQMGAERVVAFVNREPVGYAVVRAVCRRRLRRGGSKPRPRHDRAQVASSKELYVDREASRGRTTAARLLRRAPPEQRQAFARGRSPPGRPRRGVRRRRPVRGRPFAKEFGPVGEGLRATSAEARVRVAHACRTTVPALGRRVSGASLLRGVLGLGGGGAGHRGAARGDRALERHSRVGRRGAVRDEAERRVPGVVLVRPEGRHHARQHRRCTRSAMAKSSSTASSVFRVAPTIDRQLSRQSGAQERRDVVRVRVATEHRLREHELAVDVHVKDAIRAGHNLHGADDALLPTPRESSPPDPGGVGSRPSGNAVLDPYVMPAGHPRTFDQHDPTGIVREEWPRGHWVSRSPSSTSNADPPMTSRSQSERSKIWSGWRSASTREKNAHRSSDSFGFV